MPYIVYQIMPQTQLTSVPEKITTTVRLDSSLKKQAEEFARRNHMDFTTFLTFSIQNTLRYGGKIEPYYEISDAYNNKLDGTLQSFDTGIIKGSKILSTKKEVSDYLDSL